MPVVCETSKVAVSVGSLGTVAGVQLLGVFQSPLAGLRFQVALPAWAETFEISKSNPHRSRTDSGWRGDFIGFLLVGAASSGVASVLPSRPPGWQAQKAPFPDRPPHTRTLAEIPRSVCLVGGQKISHSPLHAEPEPVPNLVAHLLNLRRLCFKGCFKPRNGGSVPLI